MKIFNTAQTIGEIVAILPKASEVFKKYNIDFCCGGNRPLSQAIIEQQLDGDALLQELDEAFEESSKYLNQTDFNNISRSELIDYIVNTHHVLTKRMLPELSELTTKILRVHGSNHEELFQVHRLFHTLKTELDQHLIKEEVILFPIIKEYDQNPSADLLLRIHEVMSETESEHETAGGVLKELRKITSGYRAPEDGCSTFSQTYEKLQELEADLFQHIHLENNILFKQLGTQGTV